MISSAKMGREHLFGVDKTCFRSDTFFQNHYNTPQIGKIMPLF